MDKIFKSLRTFLTYFIPPVILSYLIFSVLLHMDGVFLDLFQLSLIAGIFRAVVVFFNKKEDHNSIS